MDVARLVVDEINELLGRGPGLLHAAQLREAAESITSNIREAYGRRGADRVRYFLFARGSAEETDEHVRASFAARRLTSTCYWRIHNRIAVIVRMLNSIMGD